ncbi:MAG TPA: hypothetical protein PKE45_25525, partial [Caldilineaceae bacterium]|nr:hypothetical protein [Caldilineaceae bacterium]
VDARGGLATVYLKHDDANLYICLVAQPGTLALRFFDLYLDTDNGREKYASDDDYSLQVNVVTGQTASQVGTGNPDQVYTPTVLDTWSAATSTNDGRHDTAEYVISRKLFSRACSSPFGLAFYHRFVHDQGDDYGMPPGRTYANPVTWLEATLENPGCIRVCSLTAEPCGPAPTATLRNADTGVDYALDAEGYVLNRDQISNGAALWALMPVSQTATSVLYQTSGDRQVVSSSAFSGANNGTMTLVVSPLHPLLVQNLSVSAQWFVQGDPARAAWLREAMGAAADFLYAFTDGQFTLGQVTVYQSYDHWEQSNLKLHTNNVFQPRAVIGGVVPTDTVDIDTSLPLTYSPGSIYMGSYWNRFGTPPGQVVYVDNTPVPTATLDLDWSLALAHELGHYLLFLFDTYTDVDGNASQELAKICTGSAMGDVYEPSNQGYIYNPAHWQSKCEKTQAYQTLKGRTEWQTIHLWHPWTITPTGFVSGPVLPAGVTQVNFVEPSTPPGELADNQLFDLLYQANETSSAEARGFIFRGNRVLEQGKPA